MKRAPDYVYDLSKLPEFIKVNEAALILRCSESKIRQAYNNGDLDIFHHGKLVLIPRESLLRFKDKFISNRAS